MRFSYAEPKGFSFVEMTKMSKNITKDFTKTFEIDTFAQQKIITFFT